MRYEDTRHLRGTGSLWLSLRLFWLRSTAAPRKPPYGNLTALSDHELQDIGLTREEAATGRRRSYLA